MSDDVEGGDICVGARDIGGKKSKKKKSKKNGSKGKYWFTIFKVSYLYMIYFEVV